jgi:hypothetical protein
MSYCSSWWLTKCIMSTLFCFWLQTFFWHCVCVEDLNFSLRNDFIFLLLPFMFQHCIGGCICTFFKQFVNQISHCICLYHCLFIRKNSRMLSTGLDKIKQVQKLFHPQVHKRMRRLTHRQQMIAISWCSQVQITHRRHQWWCLVLQLFRAQAHRHQTSFRFLLSHKCQISVVCLLTSLYMILC